MQDVGALGFITATGGRRPELITTGGRWPASMADIPTTPAIKLLKEQYDAIKERLADGQDVVLEFDIRNHFKPGPVTYYNVIADIPGTEFPDEYVIIGGHIDSWDGATGTVDNGTGVSTTLEAARILMAAGAKPRRTIRFMVWGGEEQGLLGSRHYVENNPDLMPKISCCIVHDGGTNYLGGIAGVKSQLDDFNKIFAPLINLNPDLPFEVTETQALRGGGSDHASFLRAGVPGFFWRQRGRANYTFAHHTQHDTYEEAIPEYQRHSSIVVAIGALGIANLDHLLSREGISGDGGGEK